MLPGPSERPLRATGGARKTPRRPLEATTGARGKPRSAQRPSINLAAMHFNIPTIHPVINRTARGLGVSVRLVPFIKALSHTYSWAALAPPRAADRTRAAAHENLVALPRTLRRIDSATYVHRVPAEPRTCQRIS